MRRWRRMSLSGIAISIGLPFVAFCGVMAIYCKVTAAEPQQSPWLTNGQFAVRPDAIIPLGDGITFGGGITINTRTGEVTIPKGMTPSEAAREFWNAVAVVRGALPPFPGSMPNGKATLERKP